MNEKFVKAWDFVKSLVSTTTGKVGICVLLAGLLVCLFSLTGCSSMYSLNQAVRYEYKLARESEVKSNSQLIITNQSTDVFKD